jgi:glycosyltransferase involved in cell wall biosynthesis
MTPKHVVHVIPSFGIGGVPLRMARVINHLGSRFRHSIVALDANISALAKIDRSIDIDETKIVSRRRGLVGRLVDNHRVLRKLRPDLLLTYNWGSVEWALANRIWPLSRHIHLEAGFGREEADKQIGRRVVFRRWATARCEWVVVPSRYLENLALRAWRLPREKLLYLPNGVDPARFVAVPEGQVLPMRRDAAELIVGTVAPLRPEKNVGRLIRAFARVVAARPVRLAIAGDGVERALLETLAAELGVGDRVTFLGEVNPETVLAAFDVFALSSDTEQMPNALLEAMAAARAVAAVDVGDVKTMVCPENADYIVPRDDTEALATAISRLLEDEPKRTVLGAMNRRRTETLFSQDRMFTTYSRLFEGENPA